jgi:DNA repair protein RecO (recombination protein O)
LLLRRVDYAETDLVVTFLTEELGRVAALARGARKSQRRFGGALEPIHTLRIRFDERPGTELVMLREAKIEQPRSGATESLARLEAAGRALNWVRRVTPARTPEPEIWQALESVLDRVADPHQSEHMTALATFGLRLLSALGWGIDFDRCVRCGKACPEGQAALIDAARGGLICRGCGGARLRLESEQRLRLAQVTLSDQASLLPEDVATALELADTALRAHAGVE